MCSIANAVPYNNIRVSLVVLLVVSFELKSNACVLCEQAIYLKNVMEEPNNFSYILY